MQSLITSLNFVGYVQGFDVIAQAQSGTGKTATFSIAILQKIDVGLRECQALMLAPTRELAQQIQKVGLNFIERITKSVKSLCFLCRW